MSDFRNLAVAIRQHFDAMSTGELFVTNIDGDVLYESYLDAFPAGTNEIYRTRREFDCSADKNFIRNLGNVVTINNGEIITVWDNYESFEHPFNVVAKVLADMVKTHPIVSLYRTNQDKYGVEIAREYLENNKVKNWYNLYASIASKHFSTEPDKARGEFNTKVQVFRRGLEELTTSALETVKELIKNDMLYRGEEHKKSISNFATLHYGYSKLNSDEARNLYVWQHASNPVAGFKNTVIGSLVEDLSAGVDLESAVGKFEAKVAPQNYKRSKSLITPQMIKDATKTIASLGLETALERRVAKISDVSVNNVLFVDNLVRGSMKGGIEALLMSEAKIPAPNLAKAEDISIEKFLADVVTKPNTSIEVLVKNSHQSNFATLTAPVHDEVERLFKWDNNFAWSYDGNITDSELRQRISEAGGRVDGVLRFSHMWNHDGKNQSLMDLHVFMPGCNHGTRHNDREEIHDNYGNGRRVGWNNRKDRSSGGIQDVDYVNPPGPNFIPVENITFPDIKKMPEGKYVFKIHNWSFRGPTTSGFKAEIEFGGQVFAYDYPKALKHKQWITLAEVTLKNGVFTIEHKLDSKPSSQEKWGVKTETLVPVDTIILSPNYWDDNAVGNKHWFFILKDCVNPEPARGIYNEFLRNDLDKHRKVFEILGDKTKCAVADRDQLSGLGFSSTKRSELIVVVKHGNKKRVYNINF